MTKSKKALSNVIATMTLILLTLVAIGIIWTTISGKIQKDMDSGDACGIDIIDKITINSRYTCYNESSEQFQFSLSIGDVDIDYLLISIAKDGNSQSFEMTNNASTIQYVTNYSSGTLIKLPEKNSGRTYYFNILESELSGRPDLIQIAPTIDNTQCQKTDSLSQIDDCRALI